jgi:hypothetical protein
MSNKPTFGTAAAIAYSPKQLRTRSFHRRAVEAVIWGMPAVNLELMWLAWADLAGSQPGEFIRHHSERGHYFEDSGDHLLEVITWPYGSGTA